MQYRGILRTDAGIVKSVNQDSLTMCIVDTYKGQACFSVMCDGLGGLEHGEIASGNAVMLFSDWFRNEFPTKIESWTEETIYRSWLALFSLLNKSLISYSHNHGFEMGTTATIMLMWDENYYIMHIGDCRAYEIGTYFRQITQDQTLVAREVASGRMTDFEAKRDKRRNVLLQCLGVTEKIEPAYYTGKVMSDTVYLLCSDGFRHEITEHEIAMYCNRECTTDTDKMERNIEYLIELNKRRGEKDNISAILIRADKC